MKKKYFLTYQLIGGNEHPPPSRGPPVPMRTTPCTTQVYNQQLQQQLQQQQLQQQQQLHTQRDTFDRYKKFY